MVVLADIALKMDIGLLATFLGIGVVVNAIVVFIVAQVILERAQNRADVSRRVDRAV